MTTNEGVWRFVNSFNMARRREFGISGLLEMFWGVNEYLTRIKDGLVVWEFNGGI